MEVLIKRLFEDARIPQYTRLNDAGLDLFAYSKTKKYQKHSTIYSYGTGIAVQIPTGYCGLIVPRSSIYKTDLILANPPGLIDSNYRGEIIVNFRLHTNQVLDEFFDNYEVGERVAQLLILPYPTIDFKEVSELGDTNRGTLGFGSSGR